MEIYQLKVFLEVAKHLSFTAAADALNLTQPAVSAKIKSLESSLDTALFLRLGRKIELTEIGKYLLEAGPNLIALEGRLIKEIEEIKQGKRNHLKVGCTANVASGWLPKILFEYCQKYPKIDVQCLPFETLQLLQKSMLAGEIDVGFSESNLSEFDGTDAVPIDHFQYHLVVAADHRLAMREWLSLRDLTEEAWVFPGMTTPDGMALANRLRELDLQLSDFPNHEIAGSPSLMSAFISQGHYLGFASSLQFQTERKAKLLTAIPLKEFALDSQLFMLQPERKGEKVRAGVGAGRLELKPSFGGSGKHNGKRIGKRNSHHVLKDNSSITPLLQLIDIALKRTGYIARKTSLTPTPETPTPNKNTAGRTESPAYSSPPKIPVYLQSSGSSFLGSSSLGLTTSQRPSTPEKITISIGTQNKTIQTVTAGVIIQQLGLLEHFLPREGRYRNTEYQIRWRDFTSGAPIVSGLQSDRLDIGILGDYPLLLSGVTSAETSSPVAKTRLVSFVASNPDGAGNTVIVPNCSSLVSLDDLRSRVIAVPFGSAAHGMIMRTLSKTELLPEVTLRSIEDLSIHRLTPRNSKADGYAYFAPLHDIASHSGQFRRLLESDIEQLPTFHGVVVRESFAEDHPELVIAYLKALIAAQYWYETTPSALTLVSNWVNLNPEIVAKTLAYQGLDEAGLFFPDTAIRTDWVKEHIHQLSNISGNETLGELDLETWIQPELLEMAMSGL
ncbi:MAG: LysR substrate-binding domain-containing protein [Cyanobacteria bacterium J06650_10]